MKKTLSITFILLLIMGGKAYAQVAAEDYSSYLYEFKTMPMDTAQSLQYKWDHKEILDAKLVDGMESLDNWEMSTVIGKTNVATISLSTEKVVEGKTSIKFVSPTKLPIPLNSNERYWEWQFLTRKFNNEDFSKYNRISVQIYPKFKGHRKLYLMLVLHNENNVPDKYFRDGIHTFMLKKYEWTKVVMEIPHLPRDKVTGISIVYRLQGNEPDAADTITYYADKLQFETVKPDHFEGWNTANDAISFSHTGYNTHSKKTAFTSYAGGRTFSVIDLKTNRKVLEKNVLKQYGKVGTFTVFDFSEIQVAGNYKIVYDKLSSQPFPVNENVWLRTIEKSINLYLGERCGYELPGIHKACHTDWYTVNKGDTISMAGGWHDAGDLSQSFSNTADATQILFKLSMKYASSNPKLAKRLLDEGIWGLKWLHKNHFEDGKIIGWTEIDRWTDGKIGNFDDIVSPQPRGGGGFLSVIANTQAALALKMTQPELAQKSMKIAIEDWNNTTLKNRQNGIEHYAMAVLAGTELYKLTSKKEVLDKTISLADSLLTFQQIEPMNWNIPLSGFFYQNKKRNKLFGYSHGFGVATPIAGLVELCKLFPNHANYPKWFKSIELQANYLKTISKLTAPYNMVPANVYKLGQSNGEGIEENESDSQIKNGLKMDNDFYLRMFPIWGAYRGNNPNVLSWGIGLAKANQILKDKEIGSIAQSQLEWVVGKNPFGQSQMYGEGYNFSPQYAVMTGDLVGAIPVGILTNCDRDVPYCQASIFCNYKEVWIHCTNRFLELVESL